MVFVRAAKYDSGDPIDYVISKNLHRRHLNESRRGDSDFITPAITSMRKFACGGRNPNN